MNTENKTCSPNSVSASPLCSAQEAASHNEAIKQSQKQNALQDLLPGRQPSKALQSALAAVSAMHTKKDGRTH